MPQVLVVSTTTGYQLRAFERVAHERGLSLVYATDRCRSLEESWQDRAIPVHFHDERASLAAIRERLDGSSLDGVIALGDRATVLAAVVAEEFRLPWHLCDGARVSRNKLLTRKALRAAGLPSPWFLELREDASNDDLRTRVHFPCVVKPLVLTGSRGVIRANDRVELERAVARARAILNEPDVRELRDPATRSLIVEGFVPGSEYAIEGALVQGRLIVLAVFEKPDPLDGPFFEECIYVTPARVSAGIVQQMARVTAQAALGMGLRHGPVHAECRISGADVYVHEVAARPIGGLCAQAVRFVTKHGARHSLEALLLAQAIGEPLTDYYRDPAASGVMMIPIQKGGYFRSVLGVREASRVPGVEDVVITASPGQHLRALPEGASYLGFVFARGPSSDDVLAALRAAHACLRFRIDRALI